MNKLVVFCCSLLRCLIVPLCDFCFFVVIANIFFSIIIENDVVVGEMLFQRGKIEVSETLMLVGEGQLLVLHLLYIQFFTFVDIIMFEKTDGCYG